ncbi:hypothetical protein [Bradyrhizobium sp.]|uniref:hypothetical protein n=1 Tax=Bradyrhizobium sp. TaxID=376 RepID=UPI0025BBD16E|nr:hypothetical protein [Bradyrhizobium sp.]
MTKLPPRPDFEAIEAVSHKTADRRTEILALIGNLVYSWSNNESMFIYVMMLLLNTDQTSATVVFATLNTTRARLDLVQRLTSAKVADKLIAKQLEGLVERFNETTKFRNEFNHCIYSLNERGEITSTHALRIQERRGRLQLGQVRKMDNNRIKSIVNAIGELRKLNKDLWEFLPKLEQSLKYATAKS